MRTMQLAVACMRTYVSMHLPVVVHIQWNFSIVNTIRAQLAVLYIVEPLYSEHLWGPAGCPVYSGTSL